jgi:hypothetical protein
MELFNFLYRKNRWSNETFPQCTVKGVIDHIEREIVEIKEKPDDLEEWIDLLLLAFDGCNRIGATPYEVCKMLEYKQDKNTKRKWFFVGEDKGYDRIRED